MTGFTRKTFIERVAAAGMSTAAAAALDRTGIAHLFETEVASAQPAATGAFSRFTAIAASSADALEVPAGFRADVLIEWGDRFRNHRGERFAYGFNNDFLAYFPLRGSREGLLFVNHEYPSPFFQHGYKEGDGRKSRREIVLEQDAVGNSVLHVRRERGGRWRVVSPSRYNRRITGAEPRLEFTGPLRGRPGIGTTANGSLGNCSGGITPWRTALSCEENFQDYAALADGGYGWGGEYDEEEFAKYGWVCEHDPYDPSSAGRKHTALGRFRHENAAHRHVSGKRFVVYMGDDKVNEAVYKFVSEREYRPGRDRENRRILESGKLYVARWEPEGRRRFRKAGHVTPVTPTSGSGRWVEVRENELRDTSTLLRERFKRGVGRSVTEYDKHFATNRPEDLEVAADGSVYIAMTNNETVKDSHGAVRRLVERDSDPEAREFAWADYAAGGPSGRRAAGEQGFSSPDNLTFDRAGNLWVMTDISTDKLNADEFDYHANNAIFMVPASGPNAGVAFRFANMPVQAEGTGPYFTPDEETLFINVQHPGELSSEARGARLGRESTYTSWWPRGNRTRRRNPSMPRPATIVITPDASASAARRTIPADA